MIPITGLKNRKLLPLALLAVTFSLAFAGVTPVQGTPVPQVRVGSALHAATGSLVTIPVTVKFMQPFDIFDIAVQTDPTVIDPQSITLGSLLPQPFELVNCVDGVGTGCTITDGPGVAHELAVSGTGSPATVSGGTVFTVTYLANNALPGSTIAISCQLIGRAGAQNTLISVVNGVYGTVSTSQLVNYSVTFTAASLSIPAGTSGAVTVFITSQNGFAQNVALRAFTSDASVKASLSPAGVTCNCINLAISTLTVSTAIHGTFTVTVQGESTQPARVVNSGTITVTA